MSKTVTFTKGGTVATVPGPTPSDQQIARLPRYVMGYTNNGTVYSYKRSETTRWHWSLSFRDMTAAQRDQLQSVFEATDGPGEQMTYVHTDGESYTARFLHPELEFFRSGPELIGIDLTLETSTKVK